MNKEDVGFKAVLAGMGCFMLFLIVPVVGLFIWLPICVLVAAVTGSIGAGILIATAVCIISAVMIWDGI